MSSSIVSSIASVFIASSCVGAAGGAAYGACEVAVGAGGVGFVSPGNEVSMKHACGYTRQPIGRTPAHDGTLPVNLNHDDSLGASRNGSRGETSVEDFK
eukprot:6210450-Pleurochrysis_carterae.AAC.1